jgi:hypothetical protein
MKVVNRRTYIVRFLAGIRQPEETNILFLIQSTTSRRICYVSQINT